MKITVIKRKASSHKELGKATFEIHEVNTLRAFLLEMTRVQMQEKEEQETLSRNEIQNQASSGRVRFHNLYNEQKDTLEKAGKRVLQDFQDGLFRVFIQGEEVEDIDAPLDIHEGDEVVFLQLMMLSGRLW